VGVSSPYAWTGRRRNPLGIGTSSPQLDEDPGERIMPHIVVIIAAVLAMLFSTIGVPGPSGSADRSSDQASGVVMMVLDQVEHRA
jgi:hypothetical protein